MELMNHLQNVFGAPQFTLLALNWETSGLHEQQRNPILTLLPSGTSEFVLS